MFNRTEDFKSSSNRPGCNRHWNPILCGVLGVLVAAGGSEGGTVRLSYPIIGDGHVLQVSLASRSWNVFAGRIMRNTSGGTGDLAGLPACITTFAVDIRQSYASGPGVYQSSTMAGLSENRWSAILGQGKQQAIRDVYHAAAGREFTLGRDYAAAFQVAIWKIVYDYDSNLPDNGLNMLSGTFRASTRGQPVLSASISDTVNGLLEMVGTGTGSDGLVVLRNGSTDSLFERQIAVVPLPSASLLGMSGLALAIGICCRRRIV